MQLSKDLQDLQESKDKPKFLRKGRAFFLRQNIYSEVVSAIC